MEANWRSTEEVVAMLGKVGREPEDGGGVEHGQREARAPGHAQPEVHGVVGDVDTRSTPA